MPARNTQQISSTDSTFSADSLDLVSVMVWPTQEKSRSDFAHLPFQTHNPTQPIKNTNFRPIPDPTQSNPTQPAGQPNPRTTLCYHSIFGRCRPNRMGGGRGLKKFGGPEALTLGWGWGRGWPRMLSVTICVTWPNVVVVGQTVRA